MYAYTTEVFDTTTNSLDVINNSSIKDLQLCGNLDYYLAENVKLKTGFGVIRHQYNPAVKQSLSFVQGVEESFGDVDSAYHATESFAYLETNLRFFKKLVIVPGLYASKYHNGITLSPSFQPRIQANIDHWGQWSINMAYSASTQYVHLLVNSGLGLPSELWVPSTRKVPAEQLNHWSFATKYRIKQHSIVGMSLYAKSFNNVIEYDEAIDFFINVFPPKGTSPILSSERDWENKVEIGKGRAYGFELSLKTEVEKIQAWFSYHYGRSFRTFDNINKGKEFITKYDKPHNINFGINYQPHKKWNIGLNWVYSSGQPFTIADEEFTIYFGLDTIGVNLVQAGSKNNYRLPAFHQLSLSGNYQFNIQAIKANFNFGVYNVYNRLNAFYVYATKNVNGQYHFS